jgi:O-antigen ligase
MACGKTEAARLTRYAEAARFSRGQHERKRIMLHFGLEWLIGDLLYAGLLTTLCLTVFWKPIVGVYYLVPLIPMQTIRYRLNAFPLGESMVGLVLVAVLMGLWRHKQPLLLKTPWNRMMWFYLGFTYVSLVWGALYLGTDLPMFPGEERLRYWQEYATMLALFFVVAATVKNARQIKLVLLLMCVSVFLLDHNFWETVSDRDFSSFSSDLRDEGGMGYAGVNGLAAFEAQFAIFLLATWGCLRGLRAKIACLSLAGYSAICLMYSLSRGGYAAFLAGWVVLGVLRQRILLVLLLAFLMVWTTIVPNAVKMRVDMTYNQDTGEIDHSAEVRVDMWEDAMALFATSPVLGTGFYTYAFMHRVMGASGGFYQDTHNFFVKVLLETGVIGMLVFLYLLLRFFWVGFRFSRRAKDPFFAALGLGLAGWVATCGVANFFGDRWTFLQVNGYMWVLAGLLGRAMVLDSHPKLPSEPEPGAQQPLGTGLKRAQWFAEAFA